MNGLEIGEKSSFEGMPHFASLKQRSCDQFSFLRIELDTSPGRGNVFIFLKSLPLLSKAEHISSDHDDEGTVRVFATYSRQIAGP